MSRIAGFVDSRQIPECLLSELEGDVCIIGDERTGVSWRVGPVAFEHYTSDEEPSPCLSATRILFWQRIFRTDVPPGWRVPPFISNNHRIGIASIEKNYWRRWSQRAQRDRSIWLNKNDWHIEPGTPEAFLAAYPDTDKQRAYRRVTLKRFARRVDILGDRVRIFFAYKNSSSAPQAGAAMLDLREHGKLFYESAFVLPEAKHELASTGLINHCFAYGLSENIPLFDLGNFWIPGSPASWKGFSAFKAKFGPEYITFARPLARMV
jgi:hypothetical protein